MRILRVETLRTSEVAAVFGNPNAYPDRPYDYIALPTILDESEDSTQRFIRHNPELTAKLLLLQGMRAYRGVQRQAASAGGQERKQARGEGNAMRARVAEVEGYLMEVIESLNDERWSVLKDRVTRWENGWPPVAEDFTQTDAEVLHVNRNLPFLDLAMEFLPEGTPRISALGYLGINS